MYFKKTLTLLTISMVLTATSAKAEIPDAGSEVFAKVGPTVILVSEYKQALLSLSRNKFYHGNPPEDEVLAFQQDVADQIINRELLFQQAVQLELDIDDTQLEKELDKHRQRASRRGQDIDEKSDVWQSLKQQIQQDLLAEILENNIKQGISLPSEDDLQTYHKTHADKFTKPAQFDLSTILLGVNPTAGAESWEAARQEAQDLVSRLNAGADFAELARIHSSDVSADGGGALGYIHKGMFTLPAQEAIEKLEAGEISEPLQVLEGIVIFLLNDRLPAKLMEFSQVRDRAQGLWLRDERNRYWQNYIEQLRNNTNIEITEQYLTLSGKDNAIPDNVDEN